MKKSFAPLRGGQRGVRQAAYATARLRRVKARPAYTSRTHDIDPGLVFEDHVDELKEYRDRFAWGLCPFHEDGKPSFCVNLNSGWYRCQSSSCGAEGNGIVSFVSDLLDLDLRGALEYLEQNYG